MHISDMTAGNFITKNDVDPPKIVTIRSLKKVNLAREGQEPKIKWSIAFEELDKPMVANKTNLKRIAKILGEESDEWIGQRICLYFDEEVEFGGEQVGGIRVRPATKNKPAVDPVVARSMKGAPLEDDIPWPQS